MENNKLALELFDDYAFELDYDAFNKMCDRAKSLIFGYLYAPPKNTGIHDYFAAYGFPDVNSLTPIEQIFYMAYIIYVSDFCEAVKYDEKILSFPLVLQEEIMPLKDIYYNGKKYIVDFVIDLSRKTTDGKNYVYPALYKQKYAIELDGYEFHTSKPQIEKDYERENNLRELGFTVIRFTGGQIYKNPLLCIDKLVNIIKIDIEREKGDGNI